MWSRHPIRPHNAAQVTGFPSATAPPLTYDHRDMVRPAPQRTAVEFISTASSSTVSGLLTLFPKCFSSFLHSTCSLSVSHIYLALEEVYLPLRAAIQNNPTLRIPCSLGPGTTYGAVTLSGGPFQGTSAPGPGEHELSRLQFAVRSTEITILGFGRFTRRY